MLDTAITIALPSSGSLDMMSETKRLKLTREIWDYRTVSSSGGPFHRLATTTESAQSPTMRWPNDETIAWMFRWKRVKMSTVCDIPYTLPITGRHLWFLIHPGGADSRLLTFVLPCCLTQKIYGFRCNFTCIQSEISGTSTHSFTLSFWFPVEPGSNFALSDVVTSGGNFGILKNKCSNVEFAPICDLRPFDWMITN